MLIQTKNPVQAAPLFVGNTDGMVKICLEGDSGAVYVRAEADGAPTQTPATALIWEPHFAVFGGEADADFIRQAAPLLSTGMNLVPQNARWNAAMETAFAGHLRKAERYALKHEPDVFDVAHLKHLAAQLPADVRLVPIDARWYAQCALQDWSCDFMAHCQSYEEFARKALGILAVRGEEALAGAGSYAAGKGYIEVEIDTRTEYRRQGLARACGARLILDCLARGIYPGWDAQNKESAALAQQLGYHFSHAYPVYVLQEGWQGVTP